MGDNISCRKEKTLWKKSKVEEKNKRCRKELNVVEEE